MDVHSRIQQDFSVQPCHNAGCLPFLQLSRHLGGSNTPWHHMLHLASKPTHELPCALRSIAAIWLAGYPCPGHFGPSQLHNHRIRKKHLQEAKTIRSLV